MTRPSRPKGRWGDLPKRMMSAVIMLAVGAFEIWFGGPPFALLVVVLTGLMIWELARMTEAGRPLVWAGLAAFSALVLFGVLAVPAPLGPVPLVLPPLFGAVILRRDKTAFFLYGLAIMSVGHTLVGLREQGGSTVILWLIAVVVASDVMGYFIGRRFGGPKFWPRVSPNKTWSGTVAGWVGAALVGLAFVAAGRAGWGLVALSPLIACRPVGRHCRKLDQASGRVQGQFVADPRPWRCAGPVRCADRGGAGGADPQFCVRVALAACGRLTRCAAFRFLASRGRWARIRSIC